MMTRTERSARLRPRGDRGIAVVFFAISVTAMLAVGALVLGGSIGYTAVRNAQTAADSAALAGATELNEQRQNWPTTSATDLVDKVQDVVESNGAVLSPGGCQLIRGTYGLDNDEADVIGPCEDMDGLPEESLQAVAGVRVTVEDTRNVPFNAFVDQDEITGSAVAAATIQPVISGEGWSVFMVCTSPDAIGHPARALKEVPETVDPTGYEIDGSALGKIYVLWGNKIKTAGQGRDCGNNSSSWRGLVRWYVNYPVPSPSKTDDEGWWQVEDGNTGGRSIDMQANLLDDNACELQGENVDGLEIGCRLAVPLCPFANDVLPDDVRDNEFKLYCPKMGVFEVTHVNALAAEDLDPVDYQESEGIDGNATPCGRDNNNIICGKFVPDGTARDAQGSVETPGQYDYVVIKLVE